MKKKIICIITCMIGICLLSMTMFLSKHNNENPQREIAMYISDGQGSYAKSNSIPIGKTLNTTLSKCADESNISYDSTNGIVNINFEVADSCVLYFD